jgi:hypothetical protein
VIDISWPLPESITWQLPTDSRIVTRSSDYAEIIFDKAGRYNVSLDAAIASCQSSHSQNIDILAGARPNKGGRVGDDKLIKGAKLFPNPNLGQFTVEVELSLELQVEITIISNDGNSIVARHIESGRALYKWPVSIPQIGQGVYFVMVQAGDERRVIRFVKI